MIFYLFCGLYLFVFEKVKNKIYSRCVYSGVKMLCYTTKYHDDKYLMDILGWVLL